MPRRRLRRRLQLPGRRPRDTRLDRDLLLHFLTRYDKTGGLRLVRLWRSWAEVVGPEVAELARPVGHKDGALILAAEDSVAAQELSYFAPELLERANAFLGEEIFDKVRFELLDGRAPLDRREDRTPTPAAEERRAPAQRPPRIGGLADKVDPNTAAGRCYLAYVQRLKAAQAADSAAAEDANTRPTGASRRMK